MISEKLASVLMKNSGGMRIDFYEGLRNLVENGLGTKDAIKELNNIWSYGGKKPGETLAVVTRDLLEQIANGTPLSRALSRWVPYEEASLLAAGEQSDVAQSFDDIVKVITAKQQILGAVASAVVYPAFLCVPLAILLWMVSTQMIPAMARVSSPESWTGAAFALYQLAEFVTSYGLAVVLMLAGLVAAFVFSLPRWTGSVRALFDRGPFYSTYRMVHGSTFLLNMSVMMRANIQEANALDMLGEYANPWLKERTRSARHGIAMGNNIGVALEDAGHDFPDKKAIQFIKILAARKGFSQALNKYSERWLQTSIKRIKRMATISLSVAILLLGGVMALVVVGSQDIQSNFEQSMDRSGPLAANN